jgi:hypothetical protein
MTTLSDAQAALDQAQSDHAAATAAASIATTHAISLREQIASGHGEHIGPDELAVAAQRAEHAGLVVAGATAALVGLDAAVQAARANELADEIVGAMPVLGDRLLDTLDAVGVALVDYAEAAESFDAYVTSSTRQLNAVGPASPRYRAPRHGSPQVDRISLARCNADRLLARVVGPALADLGAPAFATIELKTLAQAAGNIPATTN